MATSTNPNLARDLSQRPSEKSVHHNGAGERRCHAEQTDEPNDKDAEHATRKGSESEGPDGPHALGVVEGSSEYEHQQHRPRKENRGDRVCPEHISQSGEHQRGRRQRSHEQRKRVEQEQA